MGKPKSINAKAQAKVHPTDPAEKHARQLKVLQEISRLVDPDEKTETVLQTALHHLVTTLHFAAAQIYRLSPSGKDVWLYLEAGRGTKPVTQGADIFSTDDDNIISDTIRQNRPIYVPDVQQGKYSYFITDETGPHPQSELTVPLTSGSTTLGVLRVQSIRPDDFTGDDIDFFTGLAGLLGSTIKNAQMVRNLQDNLQEITILYKLQREDDLERLPGPAAGGVETGYQYDKTRVTLADAGKLSSTARLALTKAQEGVSTVKHEQGKELVAPIKLAGETIGVIGIEDTPEGGNWSPDDLELLEEVSAQVALAVENSRLLQQTRERTKELSILFDTSRQLSETINLRRIYQIVVSQILNYLHADICSVSLLNNARTHFTEFVARHKDEAESIAAQVAPALEAIDDSPALQQILKQPEVIIEHLTPPSPSQNGDTPRPETTHTLARFPLLVRGNLIGVIRVGHLAQRRAYTQNELQLTQAIISQVTVAVENAQLFDQTQNALAETQKLYEISRSLVESTELEDIFDVVLENVKTYGADRVSISLLDRGQSGEIEKVTIVANWDRNPENTLPVGTKISANNFSLVKAFAQPPFYPLICEDLTRPDGHDERMDEAFRRFMNEELGAVTLFSVPMFLGTEYKGVISISTRSPHTYTDEEVRIYQTLADQAIIAIERHYLLEATRRERDRTALLYEFGQKLSQTTSIQEIQAAVLSFVNRLEAAHGEIFITDDRDFRSMASSIPERQNMSPEETQAFIETVLTKGVEAKALQQQKPVLINRSQTDLWLLDDETVESPPWMQSIISTPFHSRRSNLKGVLTFFSTVEDGFTPDHISMFESMAIQVAATLENVWLLQQTAAALQETRLLYKATRDLNSAQQLEDLLAILVESFANPAAEDPAGAIQPGIDHMSLGLVVSHTAGNTAGDLHLLAAWDRSRPENGPAGEIIVTNPDTRLSAKDYPFIRHLSPDAPYHIEAGQSNTADAFLADHLGQARSMLAIPLKVGHNWLGVLFIAGRSRDFSFAPAFLNQASALAGQVAVVIQNLQLIEETQQNLYNSEILSHLSQELLTADTAETIYQLTLDAIAATEPSRGAAIFMYDQIEGNIELEIVANWDSPNQTWPDIAPGARFSTEDLGLVPLLKTGKTVTSPNAIEDERFSETLRQLLNLMQIKSLVAVPIWLNKEVNGFILIGNREQGTFSADTVRLYENIGRQASGALENRRLFDETRYRAGQLQTAAEVSQAATSYLDLDTLLSQSVDLIRDRFGFYHVSIFLVDEYQKYAVVEASTGDVGRQMLAMKHKLAVGGKSIVGTATATGKPRIALDVGADAVHFNNPLLPNTRSEMALPLVARGRVIGALDVQSTQKGAFTESDITVLQSMANQLANAIEAARSYQEAKKALDDVSKVHQHYLRSEWSSFLRQQKAVTGYRLTESGLVAVDDSGSGVDIDTTALNQAVEARHPVVVPGNSNDHPPESEPDSPQTLIAPLTLYGQVPIGAVNFEMADDNILQEEDTLSIIQAVANQAAQAIEAARLFEQTQAAREEAEALYRVGRALVTAESQQEMFNTVLRELLAILGLKQGGILFFEPDKKFGRLEALFVDNAPAQTNLRIPIEGNLSYQELIETKQPVIIADFATDPRVAAVRDINLGHAIASLLLVPVIIEDEVIGALGADSVNATHHFTEREVNLALAMADQLSIMLQNRRLLEETRRRAIQLQASSEVGHVATSILDQGPMLSRAVELIQERFGFYHVQIFLTDDTQRFLVLDKSTGQAGQTLLKVGYREEIGFTTVVGQAASRRQSVVARDTDEAGGPDRTGADVLPETRAELAVPLQVGDTLIGILDIHSTAPDAFTPEDIASMEVLAAQLAIAIRNARAFRREQETAERLKEIDKLKTQFLANMSHELRTPLNSIIGFSRVILKGIDGPLTELQKTDLTSIYNSGQHLLGLINNVLDLSKIEAGKMELNIEEVEMGPIIKGVMSTALALVKDKPVELVQEVPDNLPPVWADATRIRQVILNLVSNACKFTDEGTVTLKAVAEKEKLIISVSDTGIGIPPDQLESIFEEFTQVDASTTRKVGGTGLGLPISRHFVEMHKGQIWVDSTPGKGSTFSFAIPIKPAQEPETFEPASSAGGKNGQSRTIIAIDDDPGVINLYKRFLEKRHYEIIEVKNTDDLVMQVRAYAPAAILLDILMPDKDGWFVIKELKQDPLTKDIPIIICSIINDKNKGYALGAVDYLTKPIVESELVNALNNVFDRQKEQIKVLVIDDQADDILLIRRMLEAHNYRIIEANNGKDGVNLAQTREPALIILDLSMPDMDGFAVVEALKNSEPTRNIPIIIVSGKELTAEEHDFLTGQVEVFLRKGIFTEDELLNDVSQALARINAQPEYW